jgi:transcriptional regulator with XRE-family HTH domain
VTYRKLVGMNLKRLRLERGLTQERLADNTILDRDYLGKLERGQVNVSIDTLEILCKALSVRMDEFLKVEP